MRYSSSDLFAEVNVRRDFLKALAGGLVLATAAGSSRMGWTLPGSLLALADDVIR